MFFLKTLFFIPIVIIIKILPIKNIQSLFINNHPFDPFKSSKLIIIQHHKRITRVSSFVSIWCIWIFFLFNVSFIPNKHKEY
ncbi:hypothetical protein HanXRQr2_Chr15g0690251 [Helianthus annuus]|uniref:Uncharacterized protein n=1 Tax=Helianthus annuus TaxID=4232 RepID=A0A9K3DZG5_HELAN|nr:hypothetical protein HanXRQr2_Chr15g0690251 [Helianthus annuus]KAJ0831011.1 hypothetical protein HanPSC8_Chr15g0662121 [Helianthus annuus]